MATKYPTKNTVKKTFPAGTLMHKGSPVTLKYLPFKGRGKVYDRKGKR